MRPGGGRARQLLSSVAGELERAAEEGGEATISPRALANCWASWRGTGFTWCVVGHSSGARRRC